MSGNTVRGTWHDDPSHFRRPGRRDFLQVGMLGGLGLSLGQLLQMQEAKADIKSYASKEGTAKSVIHIFLPGGMAHQESFDPKPLAPIEYRGEFKAIPTNVSGTHFCESLPLTAKLADKLCVVRSMSHGEAAHERGTHNMFTGYRPSPAIQYPSFGAIVSHEFGVRNNLPPYVCIPNVPNEFAGTGYLSSSFGPFSLGADPATPGFTVRDLKLPAQVSDARFTTRRKALDAVNAHFRAREKSDSIDAMDSFYQRAYSMISSDKARAAFDLESEKPALRDEYGRHDAGQRMLMAKRLVQSGVRLVSMTYGGWDMHDRIKDGINRNMPKFDQAYSALIRDLDRSGMLKDTLVLISSEFGRTPKINGTAGRDHWPKVFSVVLAGGGIKGGLAYGTSDAIAAEPDQDAVSVEDWATTIYHCLGINADKELMAPGGRPIEIVDHGKVLKEWLA